jgi:hypothetical protein
LKIIFACAGTSSRWNNYLDCPKHLVPIHGIPLLKRNINLFKNKFQIESFYVSIREESKRNIYNIDPCIRFYLSNEIKLNDPPYKTLISFLKFSKENTLILLGDVLFSEDCVEKIYTNSKEEFKVYGRKYLSKITNKPYGELFAFYIPQHFKKTFIEAVLETEQLFKNGLLQRWSGWELISYIYSNKTPSDIMHVFNKRLFPESFVEIDDYTEDFDTPEDYNKYV